LRFASAVNNAAVLRITGIDVVMAKRKVSSKQLAHSIGITEANLSLLKREKVKESRFETLGAIC
jgi:putative transcriptional regulator